MRMRYFVDGHLNGANSIPNMKLIDAKAYNDKSQKKTDMYTQISTWIVERAGSSSGNQ